MCLLDCTALEQMYEIEDTHKSFDYAAYNQATPIIPVHYRELADCMDFPVIEDIGQLEVFIWHVEDYYKQHGGENDVKFIVGLYEYLTDVIGEMK